MSRSASPQHARATVRQLPSNHSPLFAPVPKPTIETGVTAMTLAVLGAFDQKARRETERIRIRRQTSSEEPHAASRRMNADVASWFETALGALP